MSQRKRDGTPGTGLGLTALSRGELYCGANVRGLRGFECQAVTRLRRPDAAEGLNDLAGLRDNWREFQAARRHYEGELELLGGGIDAIQALGARANDAARAKRSSRIEPTDRQKQNVRRPMPKRQG